MVIVWVLVNMLLCIISAELCALIFLLYYLRYVLKEIFDWYTSTIFSSSDLYNNLNTYILYKWVSMLPVFNFELKHDLQHILNCFLYY